MAITHPLCRETFAERPARAESGLETMRHGCRRNIAKAAVRDTCGEMVAGLAATAMPPNYGAASQLQQYSMPGLHSGRGVHRGECSASDGDRLDGNGASPTSSASIAASVLAIYECAATGHLPSSHRVDDIERFCIWFSGRVRTTMSRGLQPGGCRYMFRNRV